MSKTSKLAKILKGIKTAQDILDTLDSVVDVDRLVGISNAQGPLAKNLRSILTGVLDEVTDPHKGLSELPMFEISKGTGLPVPKKIKPKTTKRKRIPKKGPG